MHLKNFKSDLCRGELGSKMKWNLIQTMKADDILIFLDVFNYLENMDTLKFKL